MAPTTTSLDLHSSDHPASEILRWLFLCLLSAATLCVVIIIWCLILRIPQRYLCCRCRIGLRLDRRFRRAPGTDSMEEIVMEEVVIGEIMKKEMNAGDYSLLHFKPVDQGLAWSTFQAGEPRASMVHISSRWTKGKHGSRFKSVNQGQAWSTFQSGGPRAGMVHISSRWTKGRHGPHFNSVDQGRHGPHFKPVDRGQAWSTFQTGGPRTGMVHISSRWTKGRHGPHFKPVDQGQAWSTFPAGGPRAGIVYISGR